MVVNWLEIGVQTAIFAGLLAMAGAYLRYRVAPKLKAQAGEWAGAAIGRFWLKLTEEAQNDTEGGAPSGTGELSLGGFKVDVGTIRELVSVLPDIMKAVQFAKSLGFLGGASAGGEHPFIK